MNDDLPHVFGRGQVLEIVDAQVDHLDVGAVGAGFVRDQELAAVPGGHDSRRSIHDRAEVVVPAKVGDSGVDRHPRLDVDRRRPRFAGEDPLDLDGGGDGVRHAPEDGGEAVTGVGEDDSAPPLDRLDHQLVVSRNRLVHQQRLGVPLFAWILRGR